MAHAILISDHDFLSDTLKLNLQAFLSCKLVVIKDVASLAQLISIDQTYDFILCLTTIAKRDLTNDVHRTVHKYTKNMPLVFLGHTQQVPQGALHIADPFEILTIVRTVAKALGWSAQDLMNRPAPGYIPVPISLVAQLTMALDDLYWKSNSSMDPYVLVARKTDNLISKMTEWNRNKITELYIKAENRLKTVAELNKVLVKSVNAAIKNPKLEDASLVEDATSVVSQYLSDPDSVHQLPEEVREEMGKLANKTTELITQLTPRMPASLNKIVQLFQTTPSSFVPKHSLLTTFFCNEMVKSESWYSHQVSEKICALLFFHDIVLLPFYQKYPQIPHEEDELLKSDLLNEKERQIVRWHPQMVAQIIAQIPGMLVGLDQLVMQHHGTLNGDAADEIQDDVSILAKVVVVAEAFVIELLKSKLPLNQESKNLIIKKLSDKFKKRSYFKLISQLEKFEI